VGNFNAGVKIPKGGVHPDKWTLVDRLSRQDKPDIVLWKSPTGKKFHVDVETAGEKDGVQGFNYRKIESYESEQLAREAMTSLVATAKTEATEMAKVAEVIATAEKEAVEVAETAEIAKNAKTAKSKVTA